MRASLARSCQCFSCRASSVTPAFYDGLFATTCHNTFFYVTHTASKLNVFPIVEEREIMVQNMFDVVPLVIRLATSLVQHLTVFSCKGWLLNLFQLKRLSFFSNFKKGQLQQWHRKELHSTGGACTLASGTGINKLTENLGMFDRCDL